MNRKDWPLIASQLFNMKKRLGWADPKNPWDLPDFVHVYDMNGKLMMKDATGLGHEYLVKNPYLKELLVSSYHQLGEGKTEEE